MLKRSGAEWYSGAGREVDRVGVRSRRASRRAARSPGGVPIGSSGKLGLDRLRPPRRARRVEEVDALGLVLQRRGGLGSSNRSSCSKSSAGPSTVIRWDTPGDLAAAARATSAVAALANRIASAGVAEDVGHLVGGQARRDRRVAQARPLGGPGQLEETRVVLQHQRHGGAAFGPQAPHQVGGPPRTLDQSGVAHRLAGARHDECGLVRLPLGMIVGEEARRH